MSAPFHLPPHIVRSYDIRGIAETEIHNYTATHIGRAFAHCVTHNGGSCITVGYDGRHSSPSLVHHFIQGVMDGGVDVITIGLGPSPMLYYSVYHLNVDGGVMVTASHNPPAYNGFKFMLGKQSFYGESLQQLARLLAQGLPDAKKRGTQRQHPLQQDYAAMLARHACDASFTSVWDGGNGAVGSVLPLLLPRLAGHHHPLHEAVDGDFPNHHPDPTVIENMRDVMAAVRHHSGDVGFAFDGDGDRLGVVTGSGRMIPHDALAALLARGVLKERGAGIILADIKAGFVVRHEVERCNGQLELTPSGHSIIKERLHQTHALFAAEMSGHIFFTDPYYGFDDALYAAIRFLQLMHDEQKTSDQLLDECLTTHHSGEVRLECDGEQKQRALAIARDQADQSRATVSTIDGIRLDDSDGWWLLRASNTQDVLSVCVEGKNKQAFDHHAAQLQHILSLSGIAHEPFSSR